MLVTALPWSLFFSPEGVNCQIIILSFFTSGQHLTDDFNKNVSKSAKVWCKHNLMVTFCFEIFGISL